MGVSSVPSDIFFAFSVLFICLFVLLLLRYYLPLRTTPAYLLVPVFLAIALPASIILIVPIDLASNGGTDTSGSRGVWLPTRVIQVSWRITYWLTFVLTWAILPLLGEYSDAGYREPKDKLMYSLRSNAQYWAMVIGASIVGGIYFIWQHGIKETNPKALVMALAYAWGLIFAIFLMGHGLVAIPRHLYRTASISRRLRTIQSHAPKVHDRLMDAMDKLDQYESDVLQLRQRKTGTARDFQEWIEELAEASSLPESRAAATAQLSGSNIPTVITERYLADLTRKLKRARHRKMRFVDEWDRLVQSAINTQAILDSAAARRLEFPKQKNQAMWSRYTILTPYTRYIMYYHMAPIAYYSLSFFLSIASIVVVWSSVVKSLEAKLSLVGWSVVHHPRSDRGQIGLAGQLIAGFWILYMVACALYSITEVKVWGNRALVRRGTYPESATWYSLQVAKLTVPLAYNFITFLPPNVYTSTVFHDFLGKLIVLTPVFGGFQSLFPSLILIPVGAALFGVYGKVADWFNFGSMMEDEDDPDGGVASSWREGRALIDREIHAGSGLGSAHGTSVGLVSRDDAVDRYRDEPSSSSSSSSPPRAPASTASTAGSSSHPTQASTARVERARRPLLGGSDDNSDDNQGGGFFDDFAQRVRNTFDTADFSFERPKWMGGGGDDDDDESPARPRSGYRVLGGGDSSNRNNGWMSLFGGGRSEGRLRL